MGYTITPCQEVCAVPARGGHCMNTPSISKLLMPCSKISQGWGSRRQECGSGAGLCDNICSVVVLWGNLFPVNAKQMGRFYMSRNAGLQKTKQGQELHYAEKHPCFIRNQIHFVFSDYKANAWEISQAIHLLLLGLLQKPHWRECSHGLAWSQYKVFRGPSEHSAKVNSI